MLLMQGYGCLNDCFQIVAMIMMLIIEVRRMEKRLDKKIEKLREEGGRAKMSAE